MQLNLIFGLLIAGLIMVLCEVFIPGGIVGGIGALLILIAIGGGFAHSATLGLGLMIGSCVFGMLGFYLWVKYFPRSRMGKRFILQEDGADWHSYDDSRRELLGKTGIAHGPLRPAGTVMIDGKRIDVVTRGEMVQAQTTVEVVEVAGNRVVVAECEPASERDV